MGDDTHYLVTWPGVRHYIEAPSPEEAAERAVYAHNAEHGFDPRAEGVELSVYERVLTRHDVLFSELEIDR